MDDPGLLAPVLERSNVGMGMIVLNQSVGLDLPAINSLYTRLRNLEVNTLKRFVGFTARDSPPHEYSLESRREKEKLSEIRMPFCNGIHPRELLLAAAATERKGHLPRFSRALLWHNQELAHLIADYRKPFVCHLGGSAKNSGAALACLANFSGACESSEISVDACSMGLVPDGGMTFVLGKLPWHLGEFLALTGRTVRGVDLIYSNLIQHWMSPEALPFLELTAEKQLEVSETDGRALLDEHSLPLPDEAFQDPKGDSISRVNLPLICEVFAGDSIQAISLELRKMKNHYDVDRRNFAEDCLKRMSRACPLALSATLALIRDARESIKNETSGDPQRMYGEHGVLARALKLELRVQQKLLDRTDIITGLHARCVGREVPVGSWTNQISAILKDDVDELLREPDPVMGSYEDFVITPRSEVTLSQHPRLRRYHPDYDPVTKTDHDPVWMAAEVRRWSPDFLAEERRMAIEELLDGADPAMYGLSRWARPSTSKMSATSLSSS